MPVMAWTQEYYQIQCKNTSPIQIITNWSEKILLLCPSAERKNKEVSVRIIVTRMDGFGLTFRCKIDKILYRFRIILGMFLKTHDFCCSDRNTITVSEFICRKAKRIMNLYKASSQSNTQAIQSAKKVIEAIRNSTCSNKAAAGDKTCEKKCRSSHPRADTSSRQRILWEIYARLPVERG